MSESQISLDDFDILKVIGRGSYAKVLMVSLQQYTCTLPIVYTCVSLTHSLISSYKVELKQTKRIYAMKVIKKELVMDEEDIDWVQTEKHVFEQASNHPFLVGLHSCFQTESRLDHNVIYLQCI